MPREYNPEGPPQSIDIDVRWNAQQHRLIEVSGIALILVEKPPLNGREWKFARRLKPAPNCPRLFRDGGQFGDRLMLKNLSEREPQSGLGRARYHLNAQDGIAAQRKEIIVNPDVFDAQHAAPDFDQRPLAGISRRLRTGHGLEPARGLRQRIPVELSVRQQWQ